MFAKQLAAGRAEGCHSYLKVLLRFERAAVDANVQPWRA